MFNKFESISNIVEECDEEWESLLGLPKAAQAKVNLVNVTSEKEERISKTVNAVYGGQSRKLAPKRARFDRGLVYYYSGGFSLKYDPL